MKQKIVDMLVCPACMNKLNLDVFSELSGEILEGVFRCECGQWYPVIDGVPRFLIEDFRENYEGFFDKHRDRILKKKLTTAFKEDTDRKKRTKESFGFEWKEFARFGWEGVDKVYPRWGLTIKGKKPK